MSLREYLDRKRITYREFAEQLEVHIQSVKNIVYGKKKPSLELALRIEDLTEGEITPRRLVEDYKNISCLKPKRKYVSKHIDAKK